MSDAIVAQLSDLLGDPFSARRLGRPPELLLSTYREEIFGTAELSAAADADRYLSLLNDYAPLVERIGDTMRAQRERGIRLPAWAVPEARATMSGHAGAAGSLAVTADRCARLAPGPAGRLADGSAAIVGGRLADAFGRILDDLAVDERAGRCSAGPWSLRLLPQSPAAARPDGPDRAAGPGA